MKIILILSILFIASSGFSQNSELIRDVKDFVSWTYKLYEPNPIYLEETEKIGAIFINKLEGFPTNQFDTLTYSQLLLSNSITEYEDLQDIRRNICRRSMIFSIYALSLNKENSDFYLDLADYSLVGKQERIDTELVGFYAGFIVLEIFINAMNDNMSDTKYESLKGKYISFIKHYDKELFKQGLNLIGRLKKY